jgi:riboflavin biosynthesis protein RibD
MSKMPEQKNSRHYMRLAIKLARLGSGNTHPNPRVGAVAVKDDRIVGIGSHLIYGSLHAETLLIATASKDDLHGADLYVTLEPCAHQGKQPPCCEAVVNAGFRSVYAAVGDPNPLVAGRGLNHLRSAGIKVIAGGERLGETGWEAAKLNAPFYWSLTRKRAFITLKIAAGLDGRMAAADGSSKWITGEQSREQVHQWRAMADAIMVGKGTFFADLPQLSARPAEDPLPNLRHSLTRRITCCKCVRAEISTSLPTGGSQPAAWPSQPQRVVLDSQGETSSYIDHFVSNPRDLTGGGTRAFNWIVACNSDAPTASLHLLESAGVTVWRFEREGGARGIPLEALTERLASAGLLDVMVEGGAGLATELIKADLVDRYRLFQAPVLPSGPRLWAGDLEHPTLDDAPRLVTDRVARCGDDALIEAFSAGAAEDLRVWAAGDDAACEGV